MAPRFSCIDFEPLCDDLRSINNVFIDSEFLAHVDGQGQRSKRRTTPSHMLMPTAVK